MPPRRAKAPAPAAAPVAAMAAPSASAIARAAAVASELARLHGSASATVGSMEVEVVAAASETAAGAETSGLSSYRAAMLAAPAGTAPPVELRHHEADFQLVVRPRDGAPRGGRVLRSWAAVRALNATDEPASNATAATAAWDDRYGHLWAADVGGAAPQLDAVRYGAVQAAEEAQQTLSAALESKRQATEQFKAHIAAFDGSINLSHALRPWTERLALCDTAVHNAETDEETAHAALMAVEEATRLGEERASKLAQARAQSIGLDLARRRYEAAAAALSAAEETEAWARGGLLSSLQKHERLLGQTKAEEGERAT